MTTDGATGQDIDDRVMTITEAAIAPRHPRHLDRSEGSSGAAAPGPAIELEGVPLRGRDGTVLIDRASLAADPGELTGIIGPDRLPAALLDALASCATFGAGHQVCLLAEPTSGRPGPAADALVEDLRALADGGWAVLFTTRRPDDLRRCDRIVSLTGSGGVAFDGSPADAVFDAGSNDTTGVYRHLGGT